MAKKRQQDFPKTQLKPGRTLTRRKTNLTVKAKKLTLPKKSDGSGKSVSAILNDLKPSKTRPSPGKVASLKHLEDLINREQDISFVIEHLENLTNLTLETESNIRNAAVDVLRKIFEKKNSENIKLKILSYSQFFINILCCGMAHTHASVKGSTLVVLNIILENFPDLICSSEVVLKKFRDLIFVPRHKLSHQQSSSSILPILHDGHINNENYRIHVFDTLRRFMKEMLRKVTPDIEDEEDCDKQEVYWNCEGPLHLEIYAGGGLKPVDVENPMVSHLGSQGLNFTDPSIIDDFVIPAIGSICQTFYEEVPIQTKADDHHLQNKTIQNLNVLFQALCELTELIQLIPVEDVGKEIKEFLLNIIYKRNMFPFRPSGVFESNQRSPEAVELNLAICFLHSKFLLEEECEKEDDKECEKEDDKECVTLKRECNTSILKYISNDLFQLPFEIKNNSMPILVKILQAYYRYTQKELISDFIVETLGQMSLLLKSFGRTNKSSNRLTMKLSNRDVLIALFAKLSMNPAYDFLMQTNAMNNWFSFLLTQLTDIISSGIVNKNLLQITKIIANRKYPYFLDSLAKIDDNSFKALLKYDDPNVRDTTIFLIYNMVNIHGSLLEDISNVILLDSSFPIKYAIRFIRLLTCRFTEKHQMTDASIDLSAFRKGRTNFIQFLLNIAIDSLDLTSEKWIDYDANEYTKAMEVYKDVTAYNVLPSLEWKKHAKLFEVCHKSLSLLPQKLVCSIAMLMFKEILNLTRNIPVHSTIAILKLNNWEIKDRHYRYQLDDLLFSSLFTISVLTHMHTEDEWYKYNVVEIMDSMKLGRRTALEALQRQLINMEELNGMAAYHILRICKFYLDRQLFKPEDGERALNILENLKEKCSDSTFKQQPLFVQLYNMFYFYA